MLPAIAIVILAAAAWLFPDHYRPWVSFHADWLMALSAVVLVAWTAIREPRLRDWPLLALTTLGAASVAVVQTLAGHIHFAGDGWIATLYLLGFALMQAAGASWAGRDATARWADLLFGSLVAVALVSVVIAFDQWLGLGLFGSFATPAPLGRQPYGNLAQPNQFATLLLLGLVGAFFLRERRHLGTASLGVVAAVLCFGIAMTQSRAAWLGMAGLILWLLLLHRRASLRTPRAAVVAVGGLFAVLVLAWKPICEAFLVSSTRSLAAQAEGGTRPLHWASMLDAVGREPWVGYGWNQVSVAQSRIALERPVPAEMVEHSHNLVLDLLLWNGLPLGLLFVGALAWWLWHHVRACRDATSAMLLAAVGVVLTHAMLEFPLDYAYFLLPIGFVVGALDGRSETSPRWHAPVWFGPGLASMGAVALCAVTLEYVAAEANHRQLRMESARIGASAVSREVPDFAVLTQLEAFLRFGRTEAAQGMKREDVLWMRKVAERYPFPPVLFRYALASGLNGDPGEARDALARLCKLHRRERCEEGRDAWRMLAAERYPGLAGISFPP